MRPRNTNGARVSTPFVRSLESRSTISRATPATVGKCPNTRRAIVSWTSGTNAAYWYSAPANSHRPIRTARPAPARRATSASRWRASSAPTTNGYTYISVAK